MSPLKVMIKAQGIAELLGIDIDNLGISIFARQVDMNLDLHPLLRATDVEINAP